MKAIDHTVRGSDLAMQPVDIAMQSRRFPLKSANVRKQSGHEIPRVLTISTHLYLSHTRTNPSHGNGWTTFAYGQPASASPSPHLSALKARSRTNDPSRSIPAESCRKKR